MALDDCAAIKIEGDSIEIVTSRENAFAWLYKLTNGKKVFSQVKNGSKLNFNEILAVQE